MADGDKQYVQMPDGSYREFDAKASDEEITRQLGTPKAKAAPAAAPKTPEKQEPESLGHKFLRYTGLSEGALFGGEGYGGAMAPRTVEEALSPVEMAAFEAGGAAVAPSVKRGLGAVKRFFYPPDLPARQAAERAAATIPNIRNLPVPKVTMGDIAGTLEQEMTRPRAPIPSTHESFDAVAELRYGKPFDELEHSQQIDIVKGVGKGKEAPLVQEQRAGGERRIAQEPGSIPPIERRVGERRIPLQQELDRLIAGQSPWAEDVRARHQARISLPENARLPYELPGKQPPRAGVPAAPPTQQIMPVGGESFTRETAGGAEWAVAPGGKYRVSIQPGMSAAEINAKLAEQQALHKQMIERVKTPAPPAPRGPQIVHQTETGFVTDFGKPQEMTDTRTGETTTLPRYGVWKDLGRGKPEVFHVTDDLEEARGKLGQPRQKTPPAQPGTPERPPPEGETDPLKREFPDAAVRKFARANGPELLRAWGQDMDAVRSVHNLTNVEIREAAINSGIDLGTKHVGTKIGLGPEQISRQDLIDQMVRRGLSPDDIVEFSKPPKAGGKEEP
jgi:hypothetical protein